MNQLSHEHELGPSHFEIENLSANISSFALQTTHCLNTTPGYINYTPAKNTTSARDHLGLQARIFGFLRKSSLGLYQELGKHDT